ncbi:MAG: glycine/sarcosine/betaine reductase complex component C subunit beta [Atopobiaceae bacterium]|jgi:hypothetical protein
MKSVIKGTGYVLAHTPEMVIYNGTTQMTERVVNPDSEYLKELPNHLRTYDQVLSYLPNQVYIGNKTPEDLENTEFPWFDKECDCKDRYGEFGEIMPEDEFILLMGICDVFDLVKLDGSFIDATKDKLAADPVIDESMMARIPAATDADEIARLVKEEASEGLYFQGKLVGCVNRAHDVDHNLSAEIMHENIVEKASSVLSLLYGIKSAGIAKEDVDYVVDCSEEACGDMNQRGGGNFAKAAAEIAGLVNATGSDARGFCAAPTHALIEAASLVAAGAYKTVAVTAGGCTAKLGMNGKEHVKKDMPVLEDMIGGLCVIVTADDGVSPVVNLDALGRVAVGTGSAPQSVIGALVYDPLEKAGLTVTDVDKYSPEMQNPDITKPAGAGDVPLSNFKMIAALGVKKGQLEKAQLKTFPEEYGLPGWAPTQGHIPSGVPILGFAHKRIEDGTWKRIMVVGKGSLFLGRMTNLFDGVSVMIEANDGKGEESGVSEDEVKGMIASTMRDFASALLAQAE